MEQGHDEWIGRLPGGVRQHHKKKVEAKLKTCNERNKKDPILIPKKELFKDGHWKKKTYHRCCEQRLLQCYLIQRLPLPISNNKNNKT